MWAQAHTHPHGWQNRLCMRRRGGGHTQGLQDQQSKVIFSFNLLFEPPDLLASSLGFILTAGVKESQVRSSLRFQAAFCKICVESGECAVGRSPQGQLVLSWCLWAHCSKEGSIALGKRC